MKPHQLILVASILLLCIRTALMAQEQPRPRPLMQPPHIPDSIRAETDIPYAASDNPHQRLDLYFPKSPKGDKPLPVVVFIHGGAFQMGDKGSGAGSGGPSGFGLVIAMVASGEYAGASINYRLSQEALWPAQIYDCKAAIRWLRANGGKYRIDPDRIGVTGTSAGGHLVAMLGTSGGVKTLEGTLGDHVDVSSRVACVVDQFGPVDFLAMYGGDNHAPDVPEAKLIGGPLAENQESARNASPITYVAADNPPFLLVHGTRDPAININQSERFFAALKKAGVDATFIQVTGAGHGNFGNPEVSKRIRLFFDKHLRGQDVIISDEPIPARPG